MANAEQLAILKRGADAWNAWRGKNPSVRVDLSMAALYGADLSGADLYGVDLTGAYLTGADLAGVDLTEADLTEADLTNANLIGAKLRGANLTKANLTRADLTGADLTEVDLTRAKLRGVNLTKANLTRVDLRGADLNGADLTNANLFGVDLRGANLTMANLTGANLTGANLKRVFFASTSGTAANLTKAVLTGAHLTRKGEGSVGSGFLELATATGLDTVDFGDAAFLSAYLADAFDYALQPDLAEASKYPRFVEKAIQNIKLLHALMAKQDEPLPALVEVVHTITAELIAYLKTHPKALYSLKSRQFEELIAEVLAAYGWDVQLTPSTKDGGYDIFAVSKDIVGVTTAWIIECKKYREDRKVGVEIVRALYGSQVFMQKGGANLMLATTSYFTKGVRDYKASRYDLELRDYEGVLEWINAYRPNPGGRLYVKDNQLVLPGQEGA